MVHLLYIIKRINRVDHVLVQRDSFYHAKCFQRRQNVYGFLHFSYAIIWIPVGSLYCITSEINNESDATKYLAAIEHNKKGKISEYNSY